ncbi:MAG: diacylglycerol kinase family lipid kinase [Clostridiales bacterium]|nr:diacylglycerol kinase family lipid kinase [Clostridiales bacterium]
MEKKKLWFLFNPTSGRGQIRIHLMEIIDIFVKAGYDVTVYPTQKKEDAMRLIPQQADKYDLIVCSGGDGTLNETITGMMQCRAGIPVGYIPAGTTNDFAQSLRIPGNMLKAADIAANGIPFACDVGEFNDETFVYIAAFGIFTDVSYMTNQKLKRVLGHAAYVIEGAKQIVDIPSYVMEIRVNGEIIRDEFVYGMISNSVSVGGMKNLTGKEVELDDGLFEVTLVRRPKNPIQTSEIMTNLLIPRDCDTPYIYSCKTDHIEIHCEEAVPWTLDGEFGGDQKDVRIINHRQRVTFMVKDPEKDGAEEESDDGKENSDSAADSHKSRG